MSVSIDYYYQYRNLKEKFSFSKGTGIDIEYPDDD